MSKKDERRLNNAGRTNFRKTYAGIWRFRFSALCYLYLKDYYLAEDATQETFIKAMNPMILFYTIQKKKHG